jgi:hypothetical protein
MVERLCPILVARQRDPSGGRLDAKADRHDAVDREKRAGRQGEEMTFLSRAAVAAFFVVGAALVVAPPPVQRAEAWLRYRLLRVVPRPALLGRNDRIFLANHPGTPPNSLITNVCGGTADDAAVAHAASVIRPADAAVA